MTNAINIQSITICVVVKQFLSAISKNITAMKLKSGHGRIGKKSPANHRSKNIIHTIIRSRVKVINN